MIGEWAMVATQVHGWIIMILTPETKLNFSLMDAKAEVSLNLAVCGRAQTLLCPYCIAESNLSWPAFLLPTKGFSMRCSGDLVNADPNGTGLQRRGRTANQVPWDENAMAHAQFPDQHSFPWCHQYNVALSHRALSICVKDEICFPNSLKSCV